MAKIRNKMPSEEEDYQELFPVSLFECFDQITPMHFILSLKQSYEKTEDIVKIMRHCGAKVGFNKEDTNVYSAVIADHDDVIDFYGPTFTMKYITDCMELGKLQDIGKYRQEATKHLKLKDDKVCMQVVYYRKFGWDSVVKEEDKNWIDDNSKVQLRNDGKSYSSPTNRSRDRTAKQTKKGNDDVNDKEESRTQIKGKEETEGNNKYVLEDNFCNEKGETTNKSHTRNGIDDFSDFGDKEKSESVSVKSQSRQPYTKEEKCKILKYIVEHNEYSRLKGKELWLVMETQKVCTSRTWQSMKEHFLKKIIYDLDGYDYLTNEQKKKIQRVCF